MTKATVTETLQLPGTGDPTGVQVKLELVAATDAGDPDVGYNASVTIGGARFAVPNADGTYTFTNVAPNEQTAVASPSYRAISATAATASTATLTMTVDKPTGTTTGDWLLLAAFCGDSTSFDPTLTDTLAIESGWTLVAGPISSTATGSVNNVRGYLWKRLVDGSEAGSFTITKTGTGGYMRGVCVAVAGAGSGVDISATGYATSATDVTIPNCAATVADTLSVAIIGIRGTLLTGTPPANWTERQDTGQTISPNVLVATKSNESSGNTGTSTYDLATSNTWAAFHVVMAKTPVNTDSITSPANTVYRLTTIWADGSKDIRYIEVPDGAGPYEVADILTTAPSSLTTAGAAASSATFITNTDQTTTLANSKTIGTVIEEATSFPASPQEGWLCRRTDLGVTYRYSGSSWSAWTELASGETWTPQNRIVREADTNTQAAGNRLDNWLTGGPGVPSLAGAALREIRTAITDTANWPVNIWVVGDSISTGYYAGSRANIWHNVAADRLAARLGLPTNPYRYLAFEKTSPANPYNPWTYGSGVTLNTESSGGTDPGYGIGRFAVDIHAGENVTTTSNVVCDRVEAVYSKKSGNGTLELYIDGVLVSSVATSGTSRSTYKLDSGALTLGSHEIKVMASGGTVIAEGCYVYSGDYAGVRWLNCSKGGATTVHFNTAGTAGATAFDGMADSYVPSLVIFELGSNDISFSLPTSSIRAQIQGQISKIATATSVDPSIVFVVSPQNSYTQIAWENLTAAMYLLAQDYPSQAVVFDALNLMGDDSTGDFHTGSSDTVHPGPLGHTFLGESFAQWLLSALNLPAFAIDGGTP